MADVAPSVALMTVTAPSGQPTLAQAAQLLGVDLKDMDAVFGVVAVDPDKGIYAVQVRAERVPKQSSDPGKFQGPWSDPAIAPFGPIQEDKDRKK